MIQLNNDHSNLYKLAKGMHLLSAAKIRKIGYQKWNEKSIIFFSNKEQQERLATINLVITRLQIYCLKQAATISRSL